jgi:hypothetical protein
VFAVHFDAGMRLADGDRIRAEVKPATLRISCGEGRPVQASVIERRP